MRYKLITAPALFVLMAQQSYANEWTSNEFRKLIISNIYKTVKAPGDNIVISAISKKSSNDVVVYRNTQYSSESISCDKVENFQLLQGDTLNPSKMHLIHLKVGLCPGKWQIGMDTVKKIENTIPNIDYFDELDDVKKKEVGLYINKERLSNGTAIIYYPMIEFGQSLGIKRSFIIYPPGNKFSLIFQYSPDSMNDINNSAFKIFEDNINDIAVSTVRSLGQKAALPFNN